LVVAWRRHRRCPDDAEQGRMWLFTIARNLMANHRRTVGRRHALGDRLRQQLATAPPISASPEDSDVQEAVAGLPDQLRELVMLVHWDGFTVTEAGQLLGLNPSTARGRHAAAKQRLREILQPATTSRP
jgi:RNA polymerase sigma-70 factor (ECF subfamily)